MDSHSNTARSKLDQILHDLAIKAEEHQSAQEEEDALKGSPSDNDNMPPPTTPSKRQGRAPRKRRKKEPSADEYVDNNRPQYVLKLFDRSVDMAQFPKDASMYVMCRAWTLNKPSATYEVGSTSCSKQEVINVKKERQGTPKPAQKPSKQIEGLENMVDALTDLNILKTENLARWKKVREKWRQDSFRQQEKNMGSLTELKSLFTQP